MKTLNFDLGSLFLFATILAGLTFGVYCVGALVVMLVGLNTVSIMIITVVSVGAVMVIVHMIKNC